VATAVPGVGEILAGGEESGGIVIPPERSDALAAAMRRVLDDSALASELGERARRRVEREFSLEAVGARLNALLSSRPPSSR
jgi:glycosyltransferase involved in cell wall biosynthesis